MVLKCTYNVYTYFIMNTTIQTRIDSKLKKDSQKAFADMWLDLSTGIKIFLTQVVRTKSIPFEINSFDSLTEKKKMSIIAEAKDALKNGKRYPTIESAHRDILGEQ